MEPDPYAAHDYNPIQQGGDWRGKAAPARRPGRRRRDRPGQVDVRAGQVRQHLHRGRRLRAALRLEVRGRPRAADPAARAGPLHRGEARGPEPAAAGVHPVPPRVREVHARQPMADGAGRAGRPDARRRRVARLLPRGARERLGARHGARLLRLLPEPAQPDPHRLLRRRRDLAVGEDGCGEAAAARRRSWSTGSISARQCALAIGMYAAYAPQHRL